MTQSCLPTDSPTLQSHFNSNIGVWTLDCTSSEMIFDDVTRTILNSTELSKERILITDFFQILKPGNSASLTEQFYSFISKQDHFLSRDYCITKKNRQKLWIRVHGSVIKRDEEQAPLEARGTIVDVTEEKQEQEVLHLEAERARDILCSVNIGTWEWCLEEKTVFIDKAARDILGFSHSKCPKNVLNDWLYQIHQEDRPRFQEGIKRTLAGTEGPFLLDSLEYRFEKTPNNFIWIQTKGNKGPLQIFGDTTARGTIIDITHRKTAELNALRFKQHINNVIDATDMGSWEWHCFTDSWEYNSRFLHMLGWDHSQKVTRRALRAIVHSLDFNRENIAFKKFVCGKIETYQGDFRVRHKDGHWIWVRTFARRKGLNKGRRIQTIVGYNLDITKQKEDELRLAITQSYSHKLNLCSQELLNDDDNALQKALEHLREAADCSRAHLFQTFYDDSAKPYLQLTNECVASGVSSIAHKLASYEISFDAPPFQNWGAQLQQAQCISGCRTDFVHEEQEFLVTMDVQSVIMLPIFAKSIWVGMLCFNERDSKRIWTDDEVTFVQRAAEIVGSHTLRKNAERDLVKSEERLRSMMENGSRGIWETDLKGNLSYFTHSALFSPSNPHATSSIRNIFDFLSPEDSEKSLKTLEQCIRDKKTFPSQRNWITASDGRRACYATSGIPLLNAQKELIGFRGIYSDITEEATQEMQLQESQKMQALGKLAGGVAHDFNNQLTGIMGYADLLLEGVAQEDQTTFIKNILTCARRSADLTQQLLTFSKHSQISTNNVNISEIVEEVFSILIHSIDKRILLEKDLSQTPLTVKGDPSLLQNALLNLVLNARDSINGKGKIVIRIRLDHLATPHCEAMSAKIQAGSYAKITIADTGCGMDEKTLQRIFEPFFSTKGTQGTGMGLATAHGTITQHGGAIEVQSQLGKGTEFTIFLPICDESSVLDDVKKTTEELVHVPQHVMLIDDEQHILEIGSIYLQKKGYTVTAVDNGQDAISYIQENAHSIDLIVSDVVMPTINGWQVFQAAKDVIEKPNFIFVSGYNDEVDTSQMDEAGITAFIPKPFSKEHFLTTIAKAFDKEGQTADNSGL